MKGWSGKKWRKEHQPFPGSGLVLSANYAILTRKELHVATGLSVCGSLGAVGIANDFAPEFLIRDCDKAT